jgi:hypothetical protein
MHKLHGLFWKDIKSTDTDGAIFFATCPTMALRHKLHVTFLRLAYRAIFFARQVAAIVAESKIRLLLLFRTNACRALYTINKTD